MSLQHRWEYRFLNRQDPWILKDQRDHLENLTADLQAALNYLGSDPKRGTAALSQRILHPFCYLVCGSGAPLAQGASATAQRLLEHAAECPGERALLPTGFYRARDCRDGQLCVVQECQMNLLTPAGGSSNPSPLTIVWKPMTNGEWRVFVFATSSSPEPSALGFKRVLGA